VGLANDPGFRSKDWFAWYAVWLVMHVSALCCIRIVSVRRPLTLVRVWYFAEVDKEDRVLQLKCEGDGLEVDIGWARTVVVLLGWEPSPVGSSSLTVRHQSR
jgi:hypothetical protein